MQRASIDGIQLEYEIHGAGEPVVLIHWGVCATWAEPLLDAPALSRGYRLLNYHRAGFGGSSRVDGPISIADHAEHCRRLMHHVGIERAHLVGHSSSAAIAPSARARRARGGQDADVDGRRSPSAADSDPGGLRANVRQARDRALPRGRHDRSRRHVPGRGLRPELPPRAGSRAAGRVRAGRRWTPTRSSDRSSPPSTSGRSRKRTRAGCPSLSSSSSASAAPPRSASVGSCCSPGCRTPSRSTCPTPAISCTRRTPTAWPRHWRASSRAEMAIGA